MKLNNRQKNNTYTIEGSVMRGTITMTYGEYQEAMLFLKKTYEKAKRTCDTYTRDSLSFMQHFTGTIYEKPKDMICLGVCATQWIVKHFDLKNYRPVNYGIKVTK